MKMENAVVTAYLIVPFSDSDTSVPSFLARSSTCADGVACAMSMACPCPMVDMGMMSDREVDEAELAVLEAFVSAGCGVEGEI